VYVDMLATCVYVEIKSLLCRCDADLSSEGVEQIKGYQGSRAGRGWGGREHRAHANAVIPLSPPSQALTPFQRRTGDTHRGLHAANSEKAPAAATNARAGLIEGLGRETAQLPLAPPV
jgi:hypothetical protein